MGNLKKLGVVWLFVIMSSSISGCNLFRTPPPQDIVMIGDCEHGIVTTTNFDDIKKIFPEAQRTDILIAGGCYQQYIIKQKVVQ